MVDIGIIGTGMATKSWYLPELSSISEVRIKAISTDILEDKFVNLFPIGGIQTPKFYVGESAWVDLVESDLDAVVIAAPNYLHAPIALAAINNGTHVLIEKPVCLNLEEGRSLLDAESAHDNVIVAVAYKHRYMPNRAKAKELLNSGSLGPILGISALIGHRGPQEWSPSAGWFFDHESAGGGSLIDLGPHVLDDLLYISGEKLVTCIEAFVMEKDGIDVEVKARYKSAGGIQYSILASWQLKEYQDRIEINCENGLIILGEGGQIYWEISGVEQEELLTPPANSAGMYESGVCDRYINAIQDTLNGSDYPSLYDGVYGVAAINAAYNAGINGTPCPVDVPK